MTLYIRLSRLVVRLLDGAVLRSACPPLPECHFYMAPTSLCWLGCNRSHNQKHERPHRDAGDPTGRSRPVDLGWTGAARTVAPARPARHLGVPDLADPIRYARFFL